VKIPYRINVSGGHWKRPFTFAESIVSLQGISKRSNEVVSLSPVHDEVYSIQYYVINFVSDLRQVGGFLWILRFPPPIKLTEII
jgi:hypothetical protein